VTDGGQFGGGKMRPLSDKMRQFGDKPGGGEHCAECEAMLADALDETLSADDQVRFDRHSASCEPCGQMVADARRGAAWLELLRNPAPEPPPDLLERILAQTSWTQIPSHAGSVVPAPFSHALAPASTNVIAFPRQAFAAVRRTGFGQIMLEPRLAMTAAMAFFSIALTMNITGIHPTALRPADLKPSSLRRDFFSANARAVQYYEGLRVVYELESRVRDLQAAQDADSASPGGSEAVPAEDLAPAQPAAQPAPVPNAAPAGKQPGTTQHGRGKDAANPRTSRREDLIQTRRLVAAEALQPGSPGICRRAWMDRRLA
jgi:hypothetical protein